MRIKPESTGRRYFSPISGNRPTVPIASAKMRHIQNNIAAEAIYFWGQEIQIWRAACAHQGDTPALDWPLVRAIARDFALPLILPDWPDYPQKIATVGTLVGNRLSLTA